jgi:dipeptidyl aminopeptidase/acylaminoacyl peptidase
MQRLTIVLLFIATAAFSQQVTIENLLSVPFPTELTGGRDRVAWVANAEGSRNVWVAVGPEYKARQITSFTGDDGMDIAEMSFTPSGEAIVFTRGGDLDTHRELTNPTHQPDTPEQAIYVASLRDGSVKKLVDGNSPRMSPKGDAIVYVFKQQVMLAPLDGSKPQTLISVAAPRSDLRWSPDGTRLAFVAQRREHAFIGVYDFASKSISYLDPSVDRDSFPVWSPDSKRIAFIRVPSRQEARAFTPAREGPPWSIRVADVASGAGHEIWRAAPGDGSVYRGIVADSQVQWMVGDRLVFPWERDGWTHLYSVPVSGGTAQLLTPGEFEVEHVAVSPDAREIVYSSNQGDIDRRHIWRVLADGSKTPVAITSGKSLEWSPLFLNASTFALIHAGGQAPPIVAVISNGNIRDLTTVPPSFPMAQLVEPQQVIFTAADGMKIHAQLFLPRDNKAKHPAAVFFHGGSRRQMLLGWHSMDYYRNAYAMNEWLASRGYVVLAVNYRSGIGYGMKFREAENYGARGASEVNDAIGAALYLQSRSDVDPTRIVAWGGSYGGYMTAFSLAKASNLYAAGVDMHGVHDWNNVIRNFEPAYDPRANADLARLAFQSSPIAYVDTWKAPVLLIQGDDDRNVPFTETIHLAEELRKRGVDVEELVFPDEVHDFLLYRSWVAAYRATADFFDRKLHLNAGSAAASGRGFQSVE